MAERAVPPSVTLGSFRSRRVCFSMNAPPSPGSRNPISSISMIGPHGEVIVERRVVDIVARDARTQEALDE